MRTVLINGMVHAAPFADLFAPLTAAELAALEESGKRLGFFHPILTYDSPEHGRAVLDGLNRAELALTHSLTVTVLHLDTVPDDAAETICRRVNADRRHLSPAQQRKAREGRVKRVAAKRAEGKSLRTIAAEEGVSPEQVRQDLKDSGVNPLTPDGVTGRDGKTYAAKQPAPEPVNQADQPGGDNLDGDTPSAPVDEPDAYFKPRSSFADEVRSAVRKLKDVKSLISCVFESPHADDARDRARVHRLAWSWDGEEPVSERLGVTVMQRTWGCDELTRLFEFCCELEAVLRREVPTAPGVQPWE